MSKVLERLGALTPRQRRLLDLRLKEERVDLSKIHIIPRQKDLKSLPLSYAQQRLWFIQQLQPDNPYYSISFALRLTGDLNISALERSFKEIVRRHEVLRTYFEAVDGQPRQVIVEALPWKLEVIDLTAFAESEREDRALRIIDEKVGRPFDLSRLPLCLASLLRLREREHILIFTTHHIISDGWSMGVLVNEVSSLYEAFGTDKPSPLPELPVQYGDYTVWQRDWLQDEVLDRQRQYWKGQLTGELSTLELPTDRVRPSVQSFRGATKSFITGKEVTEGLKKVSKDEGITLFMMLLAGFQTLLHRYTGQTDLLIGTDIANRNRYEVEGLIGFFVNQLVLRTSVSGDLTVSELLKRAREVTLGAYSNQDLPFERLVQEIHPERDPSRQPLFQVKLLLQNVPMPTLELRGISLAPVERSNNSAKFDLILSFTGEGETLRASLDYSTELFDHSTIRRMARHLETILTAMIASPDARLGLLPVLTSAERHQLIVDFNQTSSLLPLHPNIASLFLAQVQRFPDAVAVASDSHFLTYTELNQRANQLAHYLQCFGIDPELTVAICLPRGIDMVVALLAVFKAGAAYLFLDTSFPLERLALMFEETQAPLILTLEAMVEELPAGWGQIICLDQLSADINEMSLQEPECKAEPENLAYIIYTSGSTGKPKGVMIEQKAVINLATWEGNKFAIDERSKVCQFFSYNFDGAAGETCMALLNGGRLEIVQAEGLEPGGMIQAINERGITVGVYVPSMLRQMEAEGLRGGKEVTIVAVGERCEWAMANRWGKVSNFINGYGPTEYTVYSHIWREEEAEEERTDAPIGKPIINTRTYILDERLEIAPLGVVGEIYLSGEGIARGYVNEPEMTAEKFLPNPFFNEVEFADRGALPVESARDEIAQFKRKRADLARPEKQVLLASMTSLSREEVSRLVDGLADDLVEKTHNFLQEYGDNSHLYEGFCRYLFEGLRDNYASCGINKEVLKTLLPYDDFSGLVGADFCFGNGEIMQTLSKMGAKVKGFDLSPYFVHKARRMGLDAAMAKVDIEPERFAQESGIAQGSLDFAISTLVLDRVENPSRLLTNLFNSLKREGRFSIQTLLPIVPFDDGNVEQAIMYTMPENRITVGESVESDKRSLVRLLYQIGGREINICQLQYVVASRDGIQSYRTFSFFGRKIKNQQEAFENSCYSRMYKTNDLGRQLRNGNIEYIGRTDHQVKIRGFRIELGEIEKTLNEHLNVKQAVVVAREDVASSTRLVAYIVPNLDQQEMDDDLREFVKQRLRYYLGQRLPHYMVPAVFVLLDELPVTPSGKIDRKALPPPEGGRSGLSDEFVAPRTASEEILVKVWSQVLGIERIGILDNFFGLGGDSILGIQIIAKANKAGLQLNPNQMFQHQTIAELAAAAGTVQAVRSEQNIVVGPIHLTPIQRWFFEQELPDRHHYNQSVMLEVRNKIDPDLVQEAFRRLLEHHDALRLRFLKQAEGWQQINSATSEVVPFVCLDLSDVSEDKLPRRIQAAAEEAQSSLDLSEGVIMRVIYFDLGAYGASHLLIIIHHLVVDGVSWRILLEDLQTVCQQLSHDERITLPAKTTSFKQWSEELSKYATSEAVTQELSYWLDETRSGARCLPIDYQQGTNTEASARSVNTTLSAKETRALIQDVPNAYRTRIDEVLLTALAQAFSSYTGGQSLLFDLEGQGRENISSEIDLSRTVGWFTTQFPVLLTIDNAADCGGALTSVKEQVRAIPNRGLGYGVLRYLRGDDELSNKLRSLPQPQLGFNYLGQFDQVLSQESWFGPGKESSGRSISLRGMRSHLLDVIASVTGGQLQASWTYSENLHKPSTIEALAEAYITALQRLIAHCLSPEAGGYTPSDFPLANIGQDDLEQAFGQVEFEGS
jgi:amino acid adenylation domain-containing protein/non-ribosomal peptide synthase protein (TIGR01720 family)